MTRDHWIVYEFMVSKFGGKSFASEHAFFQALINQEDVTRRFVPSKAWGVYNIDSKTMVAEGYYCRYGFDMIKVKNGVVSEYYRRLVSEKHASFVAYDLDIMEVTEYYKTVDNQEYKFDSRTGKILQVNNYCTYMALPREFKLALSDFEYKTSVFIYAIKPYGRIVEFNY
jgi:hypothetical protein